MITQVTSPFFLPLSIGEINVLTMKPRKISAETMRLKLLHYVEEAEDKKILALFSILESDIENSGIEFTDGLKETLAQRYLDYTTGNINPIEASESKKRIQNILHAASR